MMHRRYPIFVLISLTITILVACEPLAPDQTPQYVIVTGETPNVVIMPAATLPIAQGTPSVQSGSSSSPEPIVGGIVNTPVPTDTPIPIPTAVPSATPFVCAQSTGQVFRSSFFSQVTGADISYQIYLPPCFYDTLQRYPYVVLLHGSNFNESMWVDLDAPGTVDRGVLKDTLPPMVLVMPDGGLIAEMNDMVEGTSYETVILEELIPAVEQDFCLWGSKEGRAIGGISRGGFWAFSIAFRHPDLFSAVGGHSPHFEPENAGPATNPLDLALTISLDKNPLRIYIDHAADDYVKTYATLVNELLGNRGIQSEYVVNPTGDHSEDYWAAHVADYLAFYGKDWPFDVATLPSCLEPSP